MDRQVGIGDHSRGSLDYHPSSCPLPVDEETRSSGHMGDDLCVVSHCDDETHSTELTLDLHQFLLLDDIRHFLLLRFSLCRFLLHLRDLVVHLEHMPAVCGTERGGSDKGRVSVCEGLDTKSASPLVINTAPACCAHHVLFFSRYLTWGLEIYSESHGVHAVGLCDILDG